MRPTSPSGWPAGDGAWTRDITAQRRALQVRKDGLAALFAEGVLDARRCARGRKLDTKIAGLNTTLVEAARRSTAATLLVDGPGELRRHWDAASPDIRGKVVDELMTVTVSRHPTAGGRGSSTPT